MQNLELLFAGYLHQDWRYEYDKWQEAVTAFVRDYPAEAKMVPSEIDELLDRDLEADQFRMTVLGLGAVHNPEASGQTFREWVVAVKDTITALTGIGDR